MEGYLQTGLGILVSLILFVIGYRQTIGAKKERSKNANISIIRTIMRRMVLEDYAPIYKDISRIIEGKAREFQASANDLHAEEQILNSLFTEVFDSDLISPAQRTEIEKRINSVFEQVEKEPVRATLAEFQQLKREKESKKESVTGMVFSASLLGALSTMMFSFYETQTFDTDFLMPALSVLIGSVAVLTGLITFRKSREIEVISSKSSATFLATQFESEIAKVLIKHKFKFSIEPRIGDVRPDFLVNFNGKNIAIEAKGWRGPVPLHILRKTINFLQKLVNKDEIDEAILVTHKKDDIPPSILEETGISVVSINELANKLKNAA
jgi:hypothetical protein